MWIFEFIVELIAGFLFSYVSKFFSGIGALVFSAFTLFRISPQDWYYSGNFNERVGMGWTGFGVTSLVVGLSVIALR